MKVFVYGSLRRGERAHSLLKGARLVAEGWTPAQFTLLDLGEYPGLVAGGTTAVLGEIYEVDEAVLAELDRYEEAPEVYERIEMRIAGHDALVYVLRPEHAGQHPALETGDWSARTRR